ncbi:hypothetical protein WMF18_36240 [Sorangium sp. So ce315]
MPTLEHNALVEMFREDISGAEASAAEISIISIGSDCRVAESSSGVAQRGPNEPPVKAPASAVAGAGTSSGGAV